jgi:SAM-dependent MidA family methyltransferase
MGTLMCHRGHLADPIRWRTPGEKDITAHVDFTGIAVAAQEAGLPVLGYTSQARFLINCGCWQRWRRAAAGTGGGSSACRTNTRWASCSR